MVEQMGRREWTVTGMDCGACSTKVTRAVERLPGVSGVSVALMTERLTLDLAPGATTAAAIEETVRKLGFGIAPKGQEPPRKKAFVIPGTPPHPEARPAAPLPDAPSEAGNINPGQGWHQTAKGRLVLLTGGLLALAWSVELIAPTSLGYWAFLLACLIGVAPIARRAFTAARLGQPFTIESLMTIAALGALVIGAAEEAALVVFLFAVGEMLEGVAAGKARDGIRALAALVPKTALLETAGGPREVPAGQLRVGEVVLVRPGDRIPADGVILEGMSGIDESPVTGESVPRTKGPEDEVFAGSINSEAVLRVRVAKAAADNTISRIIRLVEEAEEARAPTERFIDRFSRWYMPAVVAIAALVVLLPPLLGGADWGTWIYRGLALLLIGCPCALVISVPASIASALSSGAKRGLLMKGGAVIEAAAKVSHVAFDKTGTLTQGKPVVTDLVPAPGLDEAGLLAIAGALEAGSGHPLALAILRRAADAGLALPLATDARALPGRGVEGRVNGAQTWITSPRHAAGMGGIDATLARQAEALEAEGKTVAAVFRSNEPLGLIALRDEPRADAADAIRQLKSLGIGATMLTGDNGRTAAAIAGGLGLDHRAEMMPEDKLAAIRDMDAAGGVMMIGDGINDAPALKQAGVGVAMGSGTDVALETADAAILRDRVTDVPALIRLARRTMGNIRQNVALALGLKAVFLVTSVLGITGLWIAILADTGATVLVTLNALRLLGYDPTKDSRSA
ncbi:MAG TPA: heavy metal translocating P-type ATPase [Paracoccus sp. (in: a-proteobacteria)]|uniref:heavy metal translocating P-type ATPase n=1 Tax=Paracoccus sp. TaxID=267 RepID=UPI002B97E3E5|nr:heavy metal translocating P-type ATPase [Paracoccus sp. (in: a-proteobacteria)]HWL57795.1 heavy metal translocating P-type ATPase [Paracoccus sp. (in: a-proteobacteria)]